MNCLQKIDESDLHTKNANIAGNKIENDEFTWYIIQKHTKREIKLR